MADNRGGRGRGRGARRQAPPQRAGGAAPLQPPPTSAPQPPPAQRQGPPLRAAVPQQQLQQAPQQQQPLQRQQPPQARQQQQPQQRQRNYGQNYHPRYQARTAAAPVLPLEVTIPTATPAIEAAPVSIEVLPEQVLDPRYSKMICFNCGVPGHFVGNCVRPKLCFICNSAEHPVYHCPEWHKDHPVAVYFGSANTGLGFYHVDVPEKSETQWLNFRNCGVVVIKSGETNAKDLEKHLSAIFCKDKRWPWQIRELSEKNFLVRFPPWKKVEDLIEFPAFDLNAEGVNVKIVTWDGKTEAESALDVVWVKIKGIPSEWCSWKTIARCTSTIGILMDVDWSVIFKSFYATVRVQVAVRDVVQIPPGRLIEMGEQFFMLSFDVERGAGSGGENSNPDPPGPTVSVESAPGSHMETEQTSAPTGGGEDPTTSAVNTGPVVRTCDLRIGPGVGECGVHFSDHASWNGFVGVDNDMLADVASENSFCSIPARWDYSRVEDSVWDFAPNVRNMEDRVEEESVAILEQSAANLAYCSGLLQDLEEDSNDEEDEVHVSGSLLDPEVCEQMSSARKNLIPIFDQLASQNQKKKKEQWGPIVASRRSSRDHGNLSILDKAKEYQKKRNLEAPARFKGKKLARHENGLGQGDCSLAKMVYSLQPCSFGQHGEEPVGARKNQG